VVIYEGSTAISVLVKCGSSIVSLIYEFLGAHRSGLLRAPWPPWDTSLSSGISTVSRVLMLISLSQCFNGSDLIFLMPVALVRYVDSLRNGTHKHGAVMLVVLSHVPYIKWGLMFLPLAGYRWAPTCYIFFFFFAERTPLWCCCIPMLC